MVRLSGRVYVIEALVFYQTASKWNMMSALGCNCRQCTICHVPLNPIATPGPCPLLVP